MEEPSKGLEVMRFPLRASSCNKMGLLMASPYIKRRAVQLAKTHDVAYIPGKLFTLAPDLKRANPSLKIITHLHDYQLICPHASLYNFLDEGRCGYVWDNTKCRHCIYRYESVVRGGPINPILGLLGGEGWRLIHNATKISEIIENTDKFITVSETQYNLICSRLSEQSTPFSRKTVTIYNPINSEVKYVPPSFDKKVCLACFSGDRYLKGFENALILFPKLQKLGRQQFLLNIIGRYHKKDRTLFNDDIGILGYITSEKLIEAYRKTWIVLFMSLWDEPLPYTVAEAQLRGRPIIASSVGGVDEEIAELGLTGESIGYTAESFIEPVMRYSERLAEQPSRMSEEIGQKANDFFNARTEKAYQDFKDLLEK